MQNNVDKRRRTCSRNVHDPKQPQIFIHERRHASMEKFAASKRAKVAADAKIAAEKAAAVAAEETAKKEKAAQRQAEMTDELLEHFDISGYVCPQHWGKTLGCPVKFDVENACKNDYEKRYASQHYLYQRFHSGYTVWITGLVCAWVGWRKWKVILKMLKQTRTGIQPWNRSSMRANIPQGPLHLQRSVLHGKQFQYAGIV